MMATAPQAETPKLNCDNNTNNSGSGGGTTKSSGLVNGVTDHNNSSSPGDFGPTGGPGGESLHNNNSHNAMKQQEGFNNRNNSFNPYDQQNHRMNSSNSHGSGGHGGHENKPGMAENPPEGQQGHYPPPPPHQYQYPPYRTGYEQQQQQQGQQQQGQGSHHNNTPEQQQHPGYQHPGYPPQPPPMRFPGKPMPGGGAVGQPQQQVGGHGYPPGQLRGSYGVGGTSISGPSGPTPTLNQLLQSSGGANAGASGSTPPSSHRYPPPPGPPTGYEHPQQYNPHSKSEYTPGPTGWPPPPSTRPPINSYGHPPPFQQQQQPMYRQSAPPGGTGRGGGPPQQHPGPYYGAGGVHHPGPGGGGYPPPPSQSSHYPPGPPHPAQRYPSPGPGMRPTDNQPPSHYPGQLPPGMGAESSGLPPLSVSNSEGGLKSTPPPSPSLAQQGMNHAQNPPSPQQSPRSTPHPGGQPPQPPPNNSSNSANSNCPPPNSPSHRPQGSSPNNSYPPPPDVGEVTGCNSNDSIGGANPNAGGVRPSPSPTGSASSRSMSPAVGNQNIPMPPRPSSSQSDGSNAPRMSQSPMPGGQGGSYPGQQSMAPPSHHAYQSGGKMAHPSGGMGPTGPGHPSGPPQSHYQPPGQQHWQQQHQPGQPGQQQPGYGAVRPPPQHHGAMMSPYPPPPPTQQPMPASSYPPPPRHPIPNHVGGPPPPQNQYSPYPPQYQTGPPPGPGQQGQPQQGQPSWPGQNSSGPGTPGSNPNSRSHSLYLKQHLQQKLGFSPPPSHPGLGGYPMGPPQSSNLPSSSPSQTPPPHHHPGLPQQQQQQHNESQENSSSNANNSGNSNPPNIVSVGPDGTNVDEVSQQSTLSNASGASGGDDGPSMPKLRAEGSRSHQNYPSHPTTPQSNAVPSPGAASMGSTHEEYEMNSPGWPRTPASPGLNSHPPPPNEHSRGKTKKADSLNKLYDMDDNPERRMFLDKLIHFMEDHNNPITSCPTISKNPLDLFKLYFLVKERGGFLEVTKNKTWKDIAGSLGIGASSSAAYTLRKHYTKHLLPFECKFDRGGIDPQPLINQVETTTKKKGKGAIPVPSPGSSNSQDSFPGPNNNTNSSMDGFNSSPSNYPSPYGQPPPSGSEYGQQSQVNSGPGGGPVPSGPQRPLGAQSNAQQGNQQQQSTPQHPGDKSQISVSNPFDDLPPANQYSHQYQQSLNHQQQGRLNYYPPFSTQPPGYQGLPGGNYPPYQSSQQGGDQYSGGRPPVPPPPHDAFGHQPYGSQSGYPPGRPGYPYPDGTTNSTLPNSASQPGYPQQSGGPQQPPTAQSPSQHPPASQQQQQASSSEDRYNMAPPSSAPSGPPSSNNYPPGPHPQGRSPFSAPGAQGPPGQGQPPNGYPGQEYYQGQSEQGYPIGGQTPGGQGSQPSGKHMPPPNQMRYPPGKEVPGGGSPYPGYPGPNQGPQPPQQRIPPYDGQSGRVMYPPVGVGGASSSQPGRDLGSPNNRSIPSSPSANVVAPNVPHPSTPSTLPNQKQWNPPEGWPNSGGHYPGPGQPRPYPGGPPGPAGSVPPPSTPPQPTTPTPAQSPGAPSSLATPPQAPSPQPWGSSGVVPPPGGSSRGPPSSVSNAQSPGGWPPQDPSRYGPNSGNILSSPPPPSGIQQSQNHPPWTPPTGGQRIGGRPPFPIGGSGKPGEGYKGYGPSPSGIQIQQPPSNQISSKGPMPMGPLGPLGPQSSLPMSPQQQQQVQQGFPSGPGPMPMPTPPSSVQIKKEIIFPPDCVEAVTPVLTRRKKLHKNDVAPIEAWRIMMCLKSGLLAETTWALDVLNVLLYDDHSISYFSLTYLPGLLDILLEHLRRALILVFGQSVGLDLGADKSDEFWRPTEKLMKWYEKKEKKEEEEPDIGTPLTKFPRDGHRTVVLHGSTNYTMVSRVSGKKVGIVAKDDEPFVVPGPRDWDSDEKSRNDPEIDQSNGTMDVTKHIVTYFSSDLKTVPIVRDLKLEEATTSSFVKVVECSEVSKIQHADGGVEDELDLEMYRCETKLASELVQILKKPSSSSVPQGNCVDSSSSSVVEKKPLIAEKSNCQLLSSSLSPNPKISSNLSVQKKVKRLDDVLGRIRKDQAEDDNAMSELPVKEEAVVVVENNSEETLTTTSNSILQNGCSDNAVMMGGASEESNLSAANSDNTCDSKVVVSVCKSVVMGDLTVRDPGCTLKRKRIEDYEDECFTRDESSLYLVTESQDALARRCLSICNIIRNLTFVPGNDVEFGKCVPFLSLIGKLILLHHDHPTKGKSSSRKVKIEGDMEDTDTITDEASSLETEVVDDVVLTGDDGLLLPEQPASPAQVDIDVDSCTSLNNEQDWWWDYVHHMREHVLVMIANISGQMDLSQFSEEISRPILDGLLHWAVCPAAYGQDPFPTLSPGAYLSPQRLAIEALCKLSVIQGNVDLLLATPPYSRIERLCQLLCRSLCRSEEQVMREFSLNLLFYLSAADSGVARTIALQNPCISLLISFIEQAEHNAMNIANSHGFSVLRENPEAMGTSLDMLRRAATTLLNLARHPDNRALFVQHEPRLLQLVMSQILEQKVAAMVAQVLYQCSTPDGPNAQKYFYSSNTETFYTPSFSRSRSSQQPHIG